MNKGDGSLLGVCAAALGADQHDITLMIKYNRTLFA